MKPIAIFILIAAFSLATASAKNATAPQNDNERVMNTVAGPPPAKPSAKPKAAQPGKRELKKAKVKAKPPLNDPN